MPAADHQAQDDHFPITDSHRAGEGPAEEAERVAADQPSGFAGASEHASEEAFPATAAEEPLPWTDEAMSRAASAAALEAAAELGGEALPLEGLHPFRTDGVEPTSEHSPGAQDADLDADRLMARGHDEDTTSPAHEFAPTLPPPPDVSEVARAFPPVAGETAGADGDAHARPAAGTHFPSDALEAFGSLDMPLPPRVEPAALQPGASLEDEPEFDAPAVSQPVVTREVTEAQALAPSPNPAPGAADEITAGTAGAPAVAGLGAARFGALNLDFDLELPPSPAQPVPTFSPEELVRIARNKLDLAAEYIELGDLAGARTLINEVIEANDVGTRDAARAMLSTLAPLS